MSFCKDNKKDVDNVGRSLTTIRLLERELMQPDSWLAGKYGCRCYLGHFVFFISTEYASGRCATKRSFPKQQVDRPSRTCTPCGQMRGRWASLYSKGPETIQQAEMPILNCSIQISCSKKNRPPAQISFI